MKFGMKLVLCIIVIIAIILSCSRFIIIRQNFMYSIENRAKQNFNKHIAQRYYVESNIINHIEIGEKMTNEKIIEYIKTLYSHIEDKSEMISLYNKNQDIIFSNFEQINFARDNICLNKEKDSYGLREIEGKNYMLLSSYVTINNEIIYIVNVYDITDIYIERERQMREIMFADLVILAIASIFISIFSALLTKPIRKLNMISKKIAKEHLGERIYIDSQDEVGELANSFNIMAEQIENKINSLNLAIKQKDDFINGFTHEMKTPLTSIIGYSDLLRLKSCDEQTTKKALNYIYYESKRLAELSYKLMDLMSLSDERIELEDIKIKEFINKVSSKILLNQIILKIDVQQSIIIADRHLLEVVIRNLIENSRKAEPRDNMIYIKGEIIKNGKYRISIIDNGKGIPKEHIERVTEAFYMVDKSRSRSNGGSGIGLSLCKKILKVHGTDINIKSEEKVGTCVFFELEVQKIEI